MKKIIGWIVFLLSFGFTVSCRAPVQKGEDSVNKFS